MSMNITYATYPTAFDVPGGGEVQLLQYRKFLAQVGLDVMLYDFWNPRLREIDVLHYFSCYRGSLNFLDEFARRGIPIVLSPTLWITRETVDDYPRAEISDMLSMASRIVCNSEEECQLLAEIFSVPRSKFSVIYNAIDPLFLDPIDPSLFRRRFGILESFILNVGNIERRKNQLRLVRAAKRLGKRLVMIGGIRDHDYFAECMELGGAGVTHIPSVPHDSPLLRSAYAGCEVFALPSLLETPGLAALEAGSSGARLVVTAVGCCREYFDDFATYVSPTDDDDIVQGLEHVLTGSPKGAGLRERIAERFTWPKVVQILADVYRNKEVLPGPVAGHHLYLAEAGPDPLVWSKPDASLEICEPGLLQMDIRAAAACTVRVSLSGRVLWDDLCLDTEWQSFVVVVASDHGPGPYRLEFHVTPSPSNAPSADPRQLGVAMRHVAFESCDRRGPELHAWLLARGWLMESQGLACWGVYKASGTGDDLHVWTRNSARLRAPGPGVIRGRWRALGCASVEVSSRGGGITCADVLTAEWRDFAWPIGQQGGRGDAWLDINVVPIDPRPASLKDPRELGLALSAVRVERHAEERP